MRNMRRTLVRRMHVHSPAYCTVKATEVCCMTAPDVAVMVTVDVPAGVTG
jgi:hypothetical protein